MCSDCGICSCHSGNYDELGRGLGKGNIDFLMHKERLSQIGVDSLF